MGLEARIWAFWIGFGPRDWDLGLGTRIWASELGEGGGRTEEDREREGYCLGYGLVRIESVRDTAWGTDWRG